MPNIRVTCSIQEGSIGKKKIKQLESVIASTYQAHFGSTYKLRFFWLNIPYEQSYLAGQISTASSVQIPVQDGLPNDRRHAFMSEICAKWQHITGCNKDEIILVSSDISHADAFMAAMDKRLEPSTKLKSKLKYVAGFFKGFFKKGYLNNSVNF